MVGTEDFLIDVVGDFRAVILNEKEIRLEREQCSGEVTLEEFHR